MTTTRRNFTVEPKSAIFELATSINKDTFKLKGSRENTW